MEICDRLLPVQSGAQLCCWVETYDYSLVKIAEDVKLHKRLVLSSLRAINPRTIKKSDQGLTLIVLVVHVRGGIYNELN